MPPTMGRFLTAAILVVGLEATALAEDPGASPVSAPETAPRKKPAMAWPLWTMHAASAGAETTLGTGEALVQMDVEPRNPQTMARLRLVYRWTGFGFKGVDDEEAIQRCEEF